MAELRDVMDVGVALFFFVTLLVWLPVAAVSPRAAKAFEAGWRRALGE